MPKTANLAFGLLNKLGPLVAKNQNRPLGPCVFTQGPLLPNFIDKSEKIRVLPYWKLEWGVSLRKRYTQKGKALASLWP